MADDFSNVQPTSYYLNRSEKPGKLHLKETEPPKERKNPEPCTDNLHDFFSNTTLHGFRYILDENCTLVERIWWVLMVICSIVACAFFIQKVWIKWNETPVIVSFAETSNSVWHIPFPAMTICSETKSRQRIFDFKKAKIERRSNAISPDDLKTYHDMLLLCKNEDDDGTEFANASSIETLRKLSPNHNETFSKCSPWNKMTCSDMFYEILTKEGYCFSFNMLSEEEMFRTENLHNDYHLMTGKNKSHWTVETGYPKDATVKTYPLRGPSYMGNAFEMELLTDIRDLDLECIGPIQGFKIWLHNPAELPNIGQDFFRLPIKYQASASITPKSMETSDGLRNYPAYRRQCYYPEERYLRFFRTYTEQNCELECQSNHTAERCGCVPFYMPHGPEMKVCGGKSKKCVEKALFELSLSESSLKENLGDACDCIQACTELKYDVDLSLAVYDEYDPDGHPSGPQDSLPSTLIVYFAEELFTSLRRSELYGETDFLANCGGIMGLFMGFSFLSLVEIIYYFTIRLWCKIRKSSTIVAAE